MVPGQTEPERLSLLLDHGGPIVFNQNLQQCSQGSMGGTKQSTSPAGQEQCFETTENFCSQQITSTASPFDRMPLRKRWPLMRDPPIRIDRGSFSVTNEKSAGKKSDTVSRLMQRGRRQVRARIPR